MCQPISKGRKDYIIDIEKILWRLDELHSYFKATLDVNSVPSQFLKDPSLASVGGPRSPDEFLNIINTSNSTLESLTSQINEQVYRFYRTLPSKSELENTCIPLLEGLVDESRHVEVFTTNYDLIIEEAIDYIQNESGYSINKGFSGRNLPRLNLELWRDIDSADYGAPLLTKLHGSVNWTKSDENINLSDGQFVGDHNRHAIVYPGFKGVPDKEPFTSFHQHFRRVLHKCDTAIFIGFAFRDEYINRICEQDLADDAYVYILDPSSDLNLPFADGITTIKMTEYFDENSAKSLSHAALEKIPF